MKWANRTYIYPLFNCAGQHAARIAKWCVTKEHDPLFQINNEMKKKRNWCVWLWLYVPFQLPSQAQSSSLQLISFDKMMIETPIYIIFNSKCLLCQIPNVKNTEKLKYRVFARPKKFSSLNVSQVIFEFFFVSFKMIRLLFVTFAIFIAFAINTKLIVEYAAMKITKSSQNNNCLLLEQENVALMNSFR